MGGGFLYKSTCLRADICSAEEKQAQNGGKNPCHGGQAQAAIGRPGRAPRLRLRHGDGGRPQLAGHEGLDARTLHKRNVSPSLSDWG